MEPSTENGAPALLGEQHAPRARWGARRAAVLLLAALALYGGQQVVAHQGAQRGATDQLPDIASVVTAPAGEWIVGAAALARAPPPRMADAPAKKAPKKVKAKNPSPFGNQPEVADPGYSIFQRPKDFEEVEQWDKYAGGAAISPSRNFEGPSWERAYARWAEDGVPRPSETQKLGRTPNLQPASNKAAREYEKRRPDASEGPQYRGKPKVTENYKKLDVSKYKEYKKPEPWQPTPNSRGYP